MGYEVCGRQPSAPVGEFFSVNCWTWVPIIHLTHELCSDLLDENLMGEMCSNSGAGPKEQRICTEVATRFDMWMEHNVNGCVSDDGELRVDKSGRKEAEDTPGLETESRFRVTDEVLKSWIEFLRHCGGFKVW